MKGLYLVAPLWVGVHLISLPIYGKGLGALTPGKIKQIGEINKGYKACVEQVVKGAKGAPGKATETSKQLAACRDQFPTVALFTECKRKAISGKSAKEVQLQEISKCNKYLERILYNGKDPVPFVLDGSEIFFAGVGLNEPIPSSALKFGNFDCGRLAKVREGSHPGEFLLFGNEISTFATDHIKATDLHRSITVNIQRRLKTLNKKDYSIDLKGFGRVYFDPKNKKSPPMVFFATGACDFSAAQEDVFLGLSTYYLVDAQTKSSTPYFGIAYFRPGAAKIKMPELVEKTIKRLGPDYKAFTKDQRTVYISKIEFNESDTEGDPKNICKLKNQVDKVVVIRATASNLNDPEYLVISNPAKLCQFGDDMTKRFALSTPIE